MMATVASLKAAKLVQDEDLARELAELAFFMIDRTVPYRTMDDPFVIKGNPRFCTQYNNSETGEHIGPMLSGTASWLTLAVFEFLGMDVQADTMDFAPILRPGQKHMACTVRLADSTLRVEVESDGRRFRTGPETVYSLAGAAAQAQIPALSGGAHHLRIQL